MQRSQVNGIIEGAKDFFAEHRFNLPPWAYWGPEDWTLHGDGTEEIKENQLGWDITDFGSGDFHRRGLLLFTLRNGNLKRDKKPYAEKIMIVREAQETPMHFHFSKMEDIINRGGAVLVLQLYLSTTEGELADSPLEVSVDGVRRKLPAGSRVSLLPGESICLEQGMYHRFWAEKGDVLAGEVSMTNDDLADNRFHEPMGRFPEIQEDVAPLHLLVGDYGRFGTSNDSMRGGRG